VKNAALGLVLTAIADLENRRAAGSSRIIRCGGSERISVLAKPLSVL
jgi:hypothetical protein